MSRVSKIRVLIADESAFMRRALRELLADDPAIEVAGEARDAVETVVQNEALNPDVIAMDINLPRRSSLEAVEEIMSSRPRPIVILGAQTGEAASASVRALELGAVDCVTKPAGAIDLDLESIRAELLRKLKRAAKVHVVRNLARPSRMASRAETADVDASGPQPVPVESASEACFPVVAVAASTGGPAALMRFLPALPAGCPGAVLLIQHMPANFTPHLSRQLAESCAIAVKEAEHGELMRPGTAYLCPGDHHLRLSPSGRLLLDCGARVKGHRPSADLTLQSLAEFVGPMAIAVVLTGMGNDGAEGVRAVRAAGGYVIAQNEATSVIFGMPAEAIKSGAVNEILPLEEIFAGIERRLLRLRPKAATEAAKPWEVA